MKKVILILTVFLMACVLFVGVTNAGAKFKRQDITQQINVQEGDMIFQHLPAQLTQVIADITQSPYSHCEIIVQLNNKWYVLEAIGPVKYTPLNTWVRRGVGSRVTVVRLKDQYRKDIPDIISAAKKFMNRPYDIQYQWDNKKIYCSELVYKAVHQGAGIRLAQFKTLGEMKWQPHEKFIRTITGGELPLERKMITPVDIVNSEKVDIIYSSFSKRSKKIKEKDHG